MSNWVPLGEFANKYNISISTLRRRIKDNSISFELKDGRYFILEEEIQKNPKGRKPLEINKTEGTTRTEEEGMISKLLEEIKKAYSLILTEKEEQIFLLKEEISDLKTLIKVLEGENERLRIK